MMKFIAGIIVALVVVLGIGVVAYQGMNGTDPAQVETLAGEAGVMETSDVINENRDIESMAGENAQMLEGEETDDDPIVTPMESMSQGGSYIEYSKARFDGNINLRRVLFFYAAWCPTCRPADQAFRANESQIPKDVVVYRVNYDTENDLKSAYGITYQHTFVQVDGDGNKVTSWNGGAMNEFLANLE